MYGQPAQPNGFTIDVGARAGKHYKGSITFVLVLGVLSLAAIGWPTLSTAGRFGGAVFAAVFFLIALSIYLGEKRRPAWQLFHVEPQGLRWEEPTDKAWAVRWDELTRLRIGATVERNQNGGRRTVHTLDLFPANPQFAEQHPPLAARHQVFYGYDFYRVLMKITDADVQQIQAATDAFRPGIYSYERLTRSGGRQV
ncbi:hypothetical protein EV191_1011366 [Tamaricihabitans halophyticus]|uniref:PH (Pleckstrin Homology) domain-containing protein n=1 Tax=Tamaricihabitans halophyticus TaxID=1262583 RepID=A0A4R2RCF4_9PSEU|nr:hypothetical protein [Tamaricihabitans halophyticus]TCP57411.1 hypothetical protein EV191_1011366 [Tamaricihabitans halophyticus]